ncbi:MAG: 3'-5' exonuclease, partial [Lachnospiraceae bacterium]|nr:3'-5' exonuclease [Lachnospiraceae bacterium]
NGKTLINEYVHPYWKKDWAAAARVNGITPEMVKDAPYPHDLIPKVKGIFEAADLLIAYNNQFDLSFLRRWGISDSGKEQYDVMLEFAQEYGEWNEYFGDYKWQKLSTAASYYGYKFKAHDSLEDVRATLYVYKKLQAQESEL